MTPKPNKEWQRAIVRLLDGQVAGPERIELEKRLIRDPQAHALLEEYRKQDRQIADALEAVLAGGARPAARLQAARAVAADQAEALPARHDSSAGRWARWSAVAAAAMLAGGVVWMVFDRDPAPPPGAQPRPERHVADVGADPQAGPHATDRQLPLPPPVPTTQVRRVDRFHVDVFDEETREVRRWSIDRERIEPRVTYIGL